MIGHQLNKLCNNYSGNLCVTENNIAGNSLKDLSNIYIHEIHIILLLHIILLYNIYFHVKKARCRT